MMGSLQIPQGLWRALGRLPKQCLILFQFSPRCVFSVFLVSLEKRSGEFGLGCLVTNS